MKHKNPIEYAHQRGEIKQSAIKAIVTDPLFKSRIERNKKGKGSYSRKEKHKQIYLKNETPFKSSKIFKWGFSIKVTGQDRTFNLFSL